MNKTIADPRGQSDGVEVENPYDPQWGSIEIEAEYVKKVIGLGAETLRCSLQDAVALKRDSFFLYYNFNALDLCNE